MNLHFMGKIEPLCSLVLSFQFGFTQFLVTFKLITVFD